jgi:hypothetical protein
MHAVTFPSAFTVLLKEGIVTNVVVEMMFLICDIINQILLKIFILLFFYFSILLFLQKKINLYRFT